MLSLSHAYAKLIKYTMSEPDTQYAYLSAPVGGYYPHSFAFNLFQEY